MSEPTPLSSGRMGVCHRYAMVDAWHPGIMLAYVLAIVVVACAMPTTPLLTICLVCGSILLFQVEGSRGSRTAGAALVLGCAVMILAPFFDTAGDRMLFVYFGRPYTFEALLRGLRTGLLVSAMLVWFACLFRIVRSDGILQVCGRIAPRIGMVTSLVMQMVPRLSRRADRVRAARIGAGLVSAEGGIGAKMHEAGAVFATVASDSLERSVVCADAMESRGYGTGMRTNVALMPFAADERTFIIVASALLGAFCVASVADAVSGSQAFSALSAILYGLFALLPVLFNTVEDARWRI